jgi:predicted transcriptional regulator
LSKRASTLSCQKRHFNVENAVRMSYEVPGLEKNWKWTIIYVAIYMDLWQNGGVEFADVPGKERSC